jgi:hypothetical protein
MRLLLEARLRAGRFEGLDPDEVLAYLGEPPAHVDDYADQPGWVRDARQWAYEAKLPPFVYPVHGWTLGAGGPREPVTWFTCRTCGTTRLGTPHREPEHSIVCSFDGHKPDWEVADADEAGVAAWRACDGKGDLFHRYETKG